MSGAEFIAVAGVISSIIAIADGIKQVVDAVSQAKGLPRAFHQASNQLPLVSSILEATVRNFTKDDVSGIEKSVALVVDSCQEKWTVLDDLFKKVIPKENSPRVERYFKAARTLGKGGKVERLMKEILEDIQLLASIKTMTTDGREKDIVTTTPAEQEQVTKAITYVSAPSAPKTARSREIPKREKRKLVRSTLNPIIERKFGRYPDSKGKETLARAVSILKNSGLGAQYAHRLDRRSFDPHKTIAEAIRRSSAEVVWALLYCLPEIKKEWSNEHYPSTVAASLDATYRRFPGIISMYYHHDGKSLLELAYSAIQPERNMENSTLILIMLLACGDDGPDINHLTYLPYLFKSPAEKKRFEELKMCLYRAQKGLLVSMEPAERREMVLSQFLSIWKARDQAQQQEREAGEQFRQSKFERHTSTPVYLPAVRTTPLRVAQYA